MRQATPAKAKVLHGPEGDGCWNAKVCHNRRSFYRNKSKDDSGHIEAIAVDPPANYFAVLYLYKEPGDKPLHALSAELWLGQKPICRLEPIHCFGLTAGKIRAYTDKVLQAFAKEYNVSLYQYKERICLKLAQRIAQCVPVHCILNHDHVSSVNNLGYLG